MRPFRQLMFTVAIWCVSVSALAQNVAVIGHPSLRKLDLVTIQKIFTGRVIEVNGIAIVAVNQVPDSLVRSQFLAAYLSQDEEKYQAYWTVRKFIGKGSPPKDLAASSEVIDFVQSHPGAIGYILDSDVKQNINVLSRK